MLSGRRYGLVVLIVAAVAFDCLASGAVGGTPPDRPARAAALVRSVRVPGGGQSIEQVWPVGAATVWAWTQDLQDLSGGAQAIERSTDGGTHWSEVTPAGLGEQVGDHWIGGFFALDADHAWVVYGGLAYGAAQAIASTSDRGRHWTLVGTRPGSNGCGLQFVSADDGSCAAVGAAVGSEGVTLYRTDDGGRHWRVLSRSGPKSSPPGSLPFGCDKDVDFTSPSVGWAAFRCAAGGAPLYETTDGGTIWIRRIAAGPANEHGGAGFAGSPVLSGANGAVAYTVEPPSPARSVVYVITDAGSSWHPVTPPGRPQPRLVDTISPLRWRLVAGNQILVTDDAGRSWRTITSNVRFTLGYPNESPPPPVVDFVTNADGWITSEGASGDLSLWRTTDAGRTWRRISVPGT
jgi:photosystem II stability/assembly factor-like uncharacterized protein